MKKLFLIPALLSASIALAQTKKIEISPMIGYNLSEGNLHFKHDGYSVYALEAQFNPRNSSWSPELSLMTSHAGSGSTGTRVTRGAFNAVKTFDAMGKVIPFAKAGLGAEMISKEAYDNTDSLYLNAGAGIKVPFNDMIALKLETIYMAKYNSARYDNNLVAMAGLNFAFGECKQKSAPVVKKVKKVTPQPVVAAPITPKVVRKDGDKDGVVDAIDECPNSPLHSRVDAKGCAEMVTLKLNFKSDSTQLASDESKIIDNFVAFLKVQTSYKTKLIAHSDASGNSKHNLQLSIDRATAIKKLLVSKGISADRITTKGMGDSSPIADNATVEGRAQNRRIEAELIK
jgi:OOP family OmpA-OmpF porin